MKDSVLSAIRHILTFGGGFLVAKGWLTDTSLEVIGSVLALAGVIWGVVDEFLAAQKS